VPDLCAIRKLVMAYYRPSQSPTRDPEEEKGACLVRLLMLLKTDIPTCPHSAERAFINTLLREARYWEMHMEIASSHYTRAGFSVAGISKEDEGRFYAFG
jgi:hypothetical protein